MQLEPRLDDLEQQRQHLAPPDIAADRLHRLVDLGQRLCHRPAETFVFEEISLHDQVRGKLSLPGVLVFLAHAQPLA